MLIRTVRPEDAEQLLQLKLQIDQETPFMLFEVGERKMTVTKQREAIERLLAENISMIFVAEHEGRIIGFLSATGGSIEENSAHALYRYRDSQSVHRSGYRYTIIYGNGSVGISEEHSSTRTHCDDS